MATTCGTDETRNPGQAEAGIALAVGQIEAAAWLLDQLAVGELGFLTGDKAHIPTWISTVAGSAENLRATLERWAIESISLKVQEIRSEMKVLMQQVN